FRDVTFTGAFCGIPSTNLTWTLINATMANCSMEVDKLIDAMTIANSTIRQINFQSASVNLFVMSGSNVTNTMNGTPVKAVISDSTLAAFQPGAYAYGRSDEVICTNCLINSFSPLGIVDQGGLGAVGVNVAYSMSGGVISVPISNGPPQWGVPGTNL